MQCYAQAGCGTGSVTARIAALEAALGMWLQPGHTAEAAERFLQPQHLP